MKDLLQADEKLSPGTDTKISLTIKQMKEAFTKEDYPGAVKIGEELLACEPPLWEARYLYALAAYEANPGKAASEKKIAQILEELPESLNTKGEVFKLQGLLALEQGEATRGKEYLSRAYALNPGDREIKKALELLGA